MCPAGQGYQRTVETLDQEYSANGLNQYIEVGGEAFVHDDRGNLTDDGARSFTYDLENRLLIASGTVEGTLAYDPLGRLRSFTHDSETIEFLYDGDRLVGEFAENELEDPLQRYAHGPGVDEPLIWYGMQEVQRFDPARVHHLFNHLAGGNYGARPARYHRDTSGRRRCCSLSRERSRQGDVRIAPSASPLDRAVARGMASPSKRLRGAL